MNPDSAKQRFLGYASAFVSQADASRSDRHQETMDAQQSSNNDLGAAKGAVKRQFRYNKPDTRQAAPKAAHE